MSRAGVDVAALAADVARLREVVRRLVGQLAADPGDKPSKLFPLGHAEAVLILSPLDAPAPDPAPDAVGGDLGKLGACVDRFAAAMKAKLRDRARAGYTGWDDPSDFPDRDLEASFRSHAYDGPGQRVDTANLAMMLWYREGEPSAVPSSPTTLPPMLDAETRALMLDARMAVLGYRDTIRRGSSPEASSFRDRMDALAFALRAAAGPTP